MQVPVGCQAAPRGDRLLFRSMVLAFAALALLSGCNTVQGVGQDMSAAGEAVADTATGVQRRF